MKNKNQMDRKETWRKYAKLDLLNSVFTPILKELLVDGVLSKQEHEIIESCLVIFPERSLDKAAKSHKVDKKWLEEKLIWTSKEIQKRIVEAYSKKEILDSMQKNLSQVEIMRGNMYSEPLSGTISYIEIKFLQRQFRRMPNFFEIISFVPNKKDHGGKNTKRRESFQEKYSLIVSKIFAAIIKKQKAS